jgi:molybdopterin-binding protein
MKLSARNQLKGKVRDVKLGTIMSEVVVQVGNQEIVAAITRGSAESLQVTAGDDVTVVIKSTDVMIAKG